MDCHHFETCFEAYLAGSLPAGERCACEAHLDRCPACRELLELAEASRRAAGAPLSPGAAEEDLVGRVLERTSGPACGRAGELLAARLDGSATSDAVDSGLLDPHLASCDDCRGLARVLAALAHDLPGLAEVRPDPDFVDEVLARTLPASVRWRRALSRWWSGRWSAWLRRPRFAWEAAFVLTVACLPVLTSAASPLVPLAETAREMAAGNAVPRLEERLGPALDAAGRAVLDLEIVERTAGGVASARGVVEGLVDRAGERAEGWAEVAGTYLGTLRDGAASFLMKAADGEIAPKGPDTTNETDSTDPTDTRAGDGSKGETR